MNWTYNLRSDVRERLCECRSIKPDLENLVNTKWAAMVEAGKDKRGFTKEDALISILELLDCNGLYFDLTKEEYNNLI